jgi:hypothetical protein
MRLKYLLEPDFNNKTRRPVGLPVLAGEKEESLFLESKSLGLNGEFELREAGRWIVGHASVTMEAGLDAATRQVYENLFRASEGLNLCRIWHYVPRINEPGVESLENYRAFCQGRSLAFEKKYGHGFRRRLPSASAVGTEDDRLTIVFAACKAEPKHFENPRQVPAYDYPKKHGPRPPSFSRATIVPLAHGLADIFISGTAAIEGHETVAPGDTAGQIVRTIHNLRLISGACGLDDNLGAKRGGERHFKVYIRHAADLPAVKTALESELVLASDKIAYLRSDICRAELNVEIEATLLGVRVG